MIFGSYGSTVSQAISATSATDSCYVDEVVSGPELNDSWDTLNVVIGELID